MVVSNRTFRVFSALMAALLVLSMTLSAGVQAQEGTGSGRLTPQGFTPKELDGQIALDKISKDLVNQSGPVKVVVELVDQPAVRVYSRVEKTQGLDAAIDAGKAQLDRILKAQENFMAQVRSRKLDVQEIYRVQRAYNGIALLLEDTSDLVTLAKLPGVKAIHPLISKTIDNASSVPSIGAPEVWQMLDGYTGEGITVAVIDTGIDYLHANFGGPGDMNAYWENDPTSFEEEGDFPTVKVIGGWDFAGDFYDAAGRVAPPIPVPDPDPLDCNGHGSHVAGTIGGYGVTKDGLTYEGPYEPGLDLNEFTIGPGVAPSVSLYALKVFGCSGSTDLTDLAIEWAMDPNDDGDFSDHVDVINMSLGSPYGSVEDSSAVAANNAVEAGVIVVTSAGNEGDSFFVTGSPGVATGAISTAASIDPLDMMDGFVVTDNTEDETIAGTVLPADLSYAYNWGAMEEPVTLELVYAGDVVPDNPGACRSYPDGSFTGKAVLIDWTYLEDGVTNECGSVVRGGNLYDAGAAGYIMADMRPVLDFAITGIAEIPGVVTTPVVGDLLKAALAEGLVEVTFTNEYIDTVPSYNLAQEDMIAYFTSRGPRRGDAFLKPDITAPGMTIASTAVGTGNQAAVYNGTSMAAPHMAGVMALMAEIHPDWTVEELKALVMNTATHPLYADANQSGLLYNVSRIGAGRVDAKAAAEADFIFYNADDKNAVSVSFGAPEVTDTYTASKTIRVVNKSGEQLSLVPSYVPVLEMPGVEVTLTAANGSPLTGPLVVPAGGSTTFSVKLTADANAMKDVYDPTLDMTGYRYWMGEIGGYIHLANGEEYQRLPVYAAPQLASEMDAAWDGFRLRGEQGLAYIDLDGIGFNTSEDEEEFEYVSVVTPLHLVGTDPQDADPLVSYADIQYVGVSVNHNYIDSETYLPPLLTFGFATYGQWNNPNEVIFDIYIDTDQDGVDDYNLFNYDFGILTVDEYIDEQVAILLDMNAGEITSIWDINGLPQGLVNTSLLNSNVMTLPVDLNGFVDDDGIFDFYVITWARDMDGVIDFSDVYTVNMNTPTFDFSEGAAGVPMYVDLPEYYIPVEYDVSGWKQLPEILLLHHHNAFGMRAEVVSAAKETFLPQIGK